MIGKQKRNRKASRMLSGFWKGGERNWGDEKNLWPEFYVILLLDGSESTMILGYQLSRLLRVLAVTLTGWPLSRLSVQTNRRSSIPLEREEALRAYEHQHQQHADEFSQVESSKIISWHLCLFRGFKPHCINSQPSSLILDPDPQWLVFLLETRTQTQNPGV